MVYDVVDGADHRPAGKGPQGLVQLVYQTLIEALKELALSCTNWSANWSS